MFDVLFSWQIDIILCDMALNETIIRLRWDYTKLIDKQRNKQENVNKTEKKVLDEICQVTNAKMLC